MGARGVPQQAGKRSAGASSHCCQQLTVEGVAADAHHCALAQALVGGLEHGLVGEGACMGEGDGRGVLGIRHFGCMAWQRTGACARKRHGTGLKLPRKAITSTNPAINWLQNAGGEAGQRGQQELAAPTGQHG